MQTELFNFIVHKFLYTFNKTKKLQVSLPLLHFHF